METEKRKLIKFSNYSLCVTLPKWVIKKLHWEKGDLVDLEVDSQSGKIIITSGKKMSKKKTISELKSKKNQLRW